MKRPNPVAIHNAPDDAAATTSHPKYAVPNRGTRAVVVIPRFYFRRGWQSHR